MKGHTRQAFILALFDSKKYFCDKSGRVFSRSKFGRGSGKKYELKQQVGLNKYAMVSIVGDKSKVITTTVHQLVWLFFKGRYDPKMDINHRDGRRTNNAISNLELATRSENIIHSFKSNGRRPVIGSRSGRAKLSESVVLLIRRSYRAGEKQKNLAVEHGVSRGVIYSVVHNKTWRHVGDF